MQNNASRKPLEIKLASVMAVSAVLRAADLAVLNAALIDLTGGVSDFFDNEFVVLDIGALDGSDGDIDWPALIGLFRSYQLNPVAVRNAQPALHPIILANGLSLETAAAVREAPPAAPPRAAQPAQAAEPVQAPAGGQQPLAAPNATMIVDTPVRAGQRIYARNADLVVTAAVNNGAEVIADGSIHVYAPLRGRALAGASGYSQARIFAMSMEAELVSIAGIYRTFEHGVPDNVRQQPVQIRSVGDRIDILPLGSAARS